MLILLNRQDVGNEVVPVEEPLAPEYVENIEHRGGVSFLNPKRGKAVGFGDRRGRGSQLQLLVRKGEDWGG
jgi:hypothetical protein